MASGKVTKRTVDALQPGPKNILLYDQDLKGFGVKVTPANTKTYFYQYRMAGGRRTSARRFTIGKHGPLTPDQARDVARKLAHTVAGGVDPAAAEKQAAQAKHEQVTAAGVAERQAAELLFEAMADRFLKEVIEPRWPSSYAFAESILRRHVTPRLRGKRIDRVTREELVRLIDAIPASQVALRRNVFAVMRPLFKWAAAGRGLDHSPLRDFEDVPRGPPSRDRVLTDGELRLVWCASGDLGQPWRAFYRLLEGTAQRREEVASLDWRELNRSKAEWHLPGSRAKNGQSNIIHLSPLMIGELDALARGNGPSEIKADWPKRGLVLTTNGSTPISGFSRAKVRLDATMLRLARETIGGDTGRDEDVEVNPWRVHDLRRTVATGFQRLGIRFEVTEAVLNHASGRSRSGVAAVYQRHEWTSEKRDALNAWSNHLKSLISPMTSTNVFSIESGWR